jgi:hypothetical protein
MHPATDHRYNFGWTGYRELFRWLRLPESAIKSRFSGTMSHAEYARIVADAREIMLRQRSKTVPPNHVLGDANPEAK